MKNQNLIDIIMPNFNKGLYIEKSINSVINQTFKDWHLFIVDDNSTDDSGIILQFTSTAAGATNNSIVSIAAGAGNGAVLDELNANEAPTDGSTGVDGVAGAAGTTGVSVNHVGWIS